jgi:hypothetical protein
MQIVCGIGFIKLEYFESKETKPPVPRNQDIPHEAFDYLTGRMILVATSHAWFYQCHPDPHGVKLKILREDFFPRLRKRFPRTKILVFDDWHSCPQWPRSKDDEIKFNIAMSHMNSVYMYCDVVLFVDAQLPKTSLVKRNTTIVPSDSEFAYFIDVVQLRKSHIISNEEEEKKDDETEMVENDIIVAIGDDKNPTVDKLKRINTPTSITFLKCPFGMYLIFYFSHLTTTRTKAKHTHIQGD